MFFRQGDIGFFKVDSIPKDATVDKTGIIARGEVTGHMHRVSNTAKAALMVANGTSFVDARQEGAKIVHDEHRTINLPSGYWEVRRQKEYEPQGWRQVAD